MNKRLIIFGVLLAALLLSAVSPWPATLRVINYTGENVYITLKYRGETKYFLTATPQGNSPFYYLSVFDIVRRVYRAEVTACGTVARGGMDLRTNVRLTFTPCEAMKQFWTPKYWGEPTQEKPNFWYWAFDKPSYGSIAGFVQHVPENDGHYGWQWWNYRFRFQYDVAPSGGTCFNDSQPWGLGPYWKTNPMPWWFSPDYCPPVQWPYP